MRSICCVQSFIAGIILASAALAAVLRAAALLCLAAAFAGAAEQLQLRTGFRGDVFELDAGRSPMDEHLMHQDDSLHFHVVRGFWLWPRAVATQHGMSTA